MLQILATSENKSATEKHEEYTYNLNISIQNTQLESVISNIYKDEELSQNSTESENKAPTENVINPIHIGFIQYLSGRISCDLADVEDIILHLTKFIEQLESIKHNSTPTVDKR